MATQDGGGGSTLLAQGGIAAAVGPGDSRSAHAADTVAAAAGLGDPSVAETVTGEAPETVAMLADFGAHFDLGALAREGGHGTARVVHARGDATGAEISHVLLRAALRRGAPVLPGNSLVDLLVTSDGTRVVGAVVREVGTGVLRVVRAATVVLATGGYGQLWANTTSPVPCRGDGLAAALRAGAQAVDLEFVQFHPTGMAVGLDPRPLATEALRGAGARLRDVNGDFVNADAAGDLAPRDVVSRAMARRMAELGASHCFLDATTIGAGRLQQVFPTFVAACRRAGLSPWLDWAPVSPTAHYTMGGVLTDRDGRTTLEGLMAVGEVGCSGLHGANRLASNSLLEGAVIGRRAALAILAEPGPVAPRPAVPLHEVVLPVPAAPRVEDANAQAARPVLREAMQAWAGVAREAGGLDRLARQLDGSPAPANMKLVARAVVALAARRRESRGAHWRTDYPATEPVWRLRQVARLLPAGDLGVGELPVVDVAASDRELDRAAAL